LRSVSVFFAALIIPASIKEFPKVSIRQFCRSLVNAELWKLFQNS
jgi:hypothetical protein